MPRPHTTIENRTRLKEFVEALKHAGFEGDFEDELSSRLVAATDNSIYWASPDAIAFPKTPKDVATLVGLAADLEIPVTARGGGTGTNGQSLNDGLILDTSRYMATITRLDKASGVAEVQPGVVLDQLNDFLSQENRFFPPTVSTSSRATIGGMFATDASGKGSRIYGKTSDYVVDAEVVLATGELCRLSEMARDHEVGGKIGNLLSGIRDEDIARVFPSMNRGLTGYNLRDAKGTNGEANLVKLLAGSEGTLAVTTRLWLRTEPKPAQKALTVISYPESLDALQDVSSFLVADPLAVEFLDDQIVDLARRSPLWSAVEPVLGPLANGKGFLFVEFAEEDESRLTEKQRILNDLLNTRKTEPVQHISTADHERMAALWEMRKRSVGLLGIAQGSRSGVPFVEDAAVPPEKLTEFVTGFRAILEEAGLSFGMFGHADVGCVHVRPRLDMLDAGDRGLIRNISDKVSQLAIECGGLIWGEHGKGIRGEFLPQYVGDDLYSEMRQVKSIFDPMNILNPGKLVSPVNSDMDIYRLDEFPMRGARDEEIDQTRFGAYRKSIDCNGNGACFDWSGTEAMCPSFKVTRDKRQSPKGRATLLREWARNRSLKRSDPELEAALQSTLSTCLSCNSCTNSCPIRVNIPDMKSHFLADHYGRHARPLRDTLVYHMETITLWSRRFPNLSNAMASNRFSKLTLERVFGLVDTPRFSALTAERIARKTATGIVGGLHQRVRIKDNTVCLAVDSFSGVFDTTLIEDCISVLKTIGFDVVLTPVLKNGKARNVRGFLPQAERTISKTREELASIKESGVLVIGLEPAVTHHLGETSLLASASAVPLVLSLDEFLAENLERFPRDKKQTWQTDKLFLHCTEKTENPEVGARWQKIFEAAGGSLDIIEAGCCGMAGMFGHEAEHQEISRDLFDLTWAGPISDAETSPLATGFSCRSQIKRFGARNPRHPVGRLLELVTEQ